MKEKIISYILQTLGIFLTGPTGPGLGPGPRPGPAGPEF